MLFCNLNKLKWVVFFFSPKLLVYPRLIWIEHVKTENWSLFCKCFFLVGLAIHQIKHCLTNKYFMLCQATGAFEYIVLSRYNAMEIHSATCSEKSQKISDLNGMH